MRVGEELESFKWAAAGRNTAEEIKRLPLSETQKFTLVQEFCVLINEVQLALDHLTSNPDRATLNRRQK